MWIKYLYIEYIQYICRYNIIYIKYIYIRTYNKLIVASGLLLNNKVDLPSKSRVKCNELFQDRT